MTTSFSFFDALKEDQQESKLPAPTAKNFASSRFYDKCRDTNAMLPRSFDQDHKSREEAKAEALEDSFNFSFRFDDPSTHNLVTGKELEGVIAERGARRRRPSWLDGQPSYWERKQAEADQEVVQEDTQKFQPTTTDDEGQPEAVLRKAEVTDVDDTVMGVEKNTTDVENLHYKANDVEKVYTEDENGKVDFDLSGVKPITPAPFFPTQTMKIESSGTLLNFSHKEVSEEDSANDKTVTGAPAEDAFPADDKVFAEDITKEVSQPRDTPTIEIDDAFASAAKKANIISGISTKV